MEEPPIYPNRDGLPTHSVRSTRDRTASLLITKNIKQLCLLSLWMNGVPQLIGKIKVFGTTIALPLFLYLLHASTSGIMGFHAKAGWVAKGSFLCGASSNHGQGLFS